METEMIAIGAFLMGYTSIAFRIANKVKLRPYKFKTVILIAVLGPIPLILAGMNGFLSIAITAVVTLVYAETELWKDK